MVQKKLMYYSSITYDVFSLYKAHYARFYLTSGYLIIKKEKIPSSFNYQLSEILHVIADKIVLTLPINGP